MGSASAHPSLRLVGLGVGCQGGFRPLCAHGGHLAREPHRSEADVAAGKRDCPHGWEVVCQVEASDRSLAESSIVTGKRGAAFQMLPTIINWLSALAAMVAAGLWYRASVVSVPPAPSPTTGWAPAEITVSNGTSSEDPFATARASSRLNARAAIVASAAAFLQGVAVLLPLVPGLSRLF